MNIPKRTQALRHVDAAEDLLNEACLRPGVLRNDLIAEAQVHATLALFYQREDNPC